MFLPTVAWHATAKGVLNELVVPRTCPGIKIFFSSRDEAPEGVFLPTVALHATVKGVLKE